MHNNYRTQYRVNLKSSNCKARKALCKLQLVIGHEQQHSKELDLNNSQHLSPPSMRILSPHMCAEETAREPTATTSSGR